MDDRFSIMLRKPGAMESLGAALRLGKKFKIQHLRKEALDILKKEFPICQLEFLASTHPTARDELLSSGAYFQLTSLLHEGGIQTILPVVYLLT